MAKAVLIRSRNRAILAKALESGFTQFLLESDQREVGRIDAYRLRNGGDVVHNGRVVGRHVKIERREDELAVRRLKGKVPLVIVEPANWKIIPLENLIAALGGKTRLYAVARDAQEAKLFLTTLEKGVDGVVVSPKSIKDLAPLKTLLEPPRPKAKLVPATITRLDPVGMGERVCVDTANLFDPGEGLLVGSTSHGFFLVAAECYETEYVAARPFRVNAGAVHAYVWNGEKTKYLSEVKAGVELEAVKPDGSRRTVVVGRAKVESRPLLLVEAETGRKRYTLIVQNAETIRLVQPTGRAKSVSQLKLGDKVLLHRETGARHFGMKIEERIREA